MSDHGTSMSVVCGSCKHCVHIERMFAHAQTITRDAAESIMNECAALTEIHSQITQQHIMIQIIACESFSNDRSSESKIDYVIQRAVTTDYIADIRDMINTMNDQYVVTQSLADVRTVIRLINDALIDI